jgi:hypothetical protein
MTNPDRDGKIFVGKGASDAYLALALANRHGLVTGATGTGKTVSLQVLAEGFSRAGVPVFAADIKGDLSGIAARGEAKPDFVKRAKDLGFDYAPEEFPVVFWDLFAEQGHPIRATVFEMGPLLVSRMLELNDVEEGVINVAFRFADDDPELKACDDVDGLVGLKDLQRAPVLPFEEHEGGQRPLRQRRGDCRRRRRAPAPGAREPGRCQILRRAGAVGRRSDADRQQRSRHHQRACR